MSKKLTLILFSLFSLASIANSQNQIPTIYDVVHKFYSTYELPTNSYVNFEKRKGQWTIMISTYEEIMAATGKKYPFYDTTTKKYQPLPLAEKEDTLEKDQRQDEYDIMSFQIHDFYGYRGWYKDVIADLENKTAYSDSSLYSLGRAYSAYARALVDPDIYSVKEESFVLPMTENCMNATQYNKYCDLQQLAIKTFERLKKQNNNFQTLVGKIDTKYANEVITGFHTCLIYNKKQSASYTLPDGLYPDSVIKKTKDVLNACPKNSILVSLGDNDFYPILYVQQKMKVRRDVYLINKNLLGVDRYIFSASMPQFESRPIGYSANYNMYKQRTNDYVFLEKNNTILSFDSISRKMQKESKQDSIITLPSSSFSINRNVPGTDTDATIFSANTEYLWRNDWIFLDILNNLKGRHVCCQTELYDFCSPLNKYFSKVGDLYIY